MAPLSQSPPRTYSFADLVLDSGQHRLRRGDEEIRLSKLSFDALQALVEAAPNLLTHEQLTRAVWGSRRVVTPENLSQRLMMLRQALGEHADHPKYIEAVRGHGYRLISKVVVVPDRSVTARSIVRRSIVVVGALLIATALWLYLSHATERAKSTEDSQAANEQTVQFEINAPGTGEPGSFALSPDGQYLAFLSEEDGPLRLWIRPVASAAAVPLAGTNNAEYPFWSPDSQSVAFMAGGFLRTVNVNTGIVQDLTRTIQAPQGGSWGSGGILYNADFLGPVFRLIPGTDGSPTPSPVTIVDEPLQSGHVFPHWLPDGRHFLYFVRGDPTVAGVWIADIEASERYVEAATAAKGDAAAEQRARETYFSDPSAPRRLVEADSVAVYAEPGRLLYVNDGALVAQPFDLSKLSLQGDPVPIAAPLSSVFGSASFTASATGSIAYRKETSDRFRFIRVDRTGQELEQLGSTAEYHRGTFALSPDSQKAALILPDARGSQGIDIWLLDFARPTLSKLTHAAGNEFLPIWSPDGSRVAYASFQTPGPTNVFAKAVSSTREGELLFGTSENVWPADWSNDGRYLLFYDFQFGSPDLWAVSLDPPGEPFAVTHSEFAKWRAQFSPDSKWIAYESNESDQVEVWIQSFPEGRKWQVSQGGGSQARWRDDGRELYYVSGDRRLMAVALEPSEEAKELGIGPPVPLFPIRLGQNSSEEARDGYSYAVGANGSEFILDVSNDEPLVVTVNWARGE